MLTLIRKTSELLERRSKDSSVGFVPTMGNLHLGHISLLERALADSDTVYFSIFVNPKQFGPNEDFTRYPRTLDSDLTLIRETLKTRPEKRVVVFSPEKPEEVFPPGMEQNIAVLGLDTIIEGKARPGHFQGVATVVYRLFDLIKPAKAYFGLKDYQQYLVIREMVRDLVLPIEIVGMPIIRESSGLALSSRNQYLDEDQRELATTLYRALRKVEAAVNGERGNVEKAFALISDLKSSDPNWNYLELRDGGTLSEDISRSKTLTLLGVYQLGATRLLDNLQMELK